MALCFVPYIEGIRYCLETGAIIAQSSRLAAMLSETGAAVIPFRVGKISPLSWDTEILHTLRQNDWLAFSSANGVHAFLWNLREHNLSGDMLPPVHLAAVGEKTAKALSAFGMTPDLIPQGETGTALGEALSEVCSSGTQVLWFSAEKTGRGFESNLNSSISLHKIPCYRNTPAVQPLSGTDREQIRRCTASFFTSASAAARAYEALDGALPGEIYSIGPECTAKLCALGVPSVREAEMPSYESLLRRFTTGR